MNFLERNIKADVTRFFQPLIDETYFEDKTIIEYDLGIGNVGNISEFDEIIKEIVEESFPKLLIRCHKYPGTQGYLPLNELLADIYQKKSGFSIKPEDIILTIGGSDAITELIQIYCSHDEGIVYALPSFPYWGMTAKANAKEYYIVITSQKEFNESFPSKLEETLTINPNIRLLLINFPNNPVGYNGAEQTCKEINEICAKHKVKILFDDIYGGLAEWRIKLFDPKNLFIIDSFSKRFAMPGLRLGFIIAPTNEMKNIRPFIANQYVGPSLISILVGYEIVKRLAEKDKLDFVFKKIKLRKETINNELKKLKIKTEKTFGMYVIIDFTETDLNARDVYNKLLKEKIRTVPYDLFYPPFYKGTKRNFIRLSVGMEPNVKQGSQKLVKIINELL